MDAEDVLELKLAYAVKANDMDYVYEVMLSDNPESYPYRDSFVLDIACASGHLDMAKHIISRYKEINIQFNLQAAFDKATYTAGSCNRKHILNYFLENSNNKRSTLQFGLMGASAGGNIKLMKYLIKNGALPDMTWMTVSPIICACENGELEVMKYLVEIGVKLKKFGPRLLSAACERGLADIVNYLIDNGIDINRTYKGVLPAYTAIVNNKPEILMILLKRGSFYYGGYFTYAAYHNHMDILKEALSKFSDSDFIRDVINNAAHNACGGGNLEILKYLLEEKGAVVRSKSIRYAAKSGNLDIIKFLMEERDIKLDEGPGGDLYDISKQGKLNVLKYLETRGVQIDCDDVLIAAMVYRQFHVLKYVLGRKEVLPKIATIKEIYHYLLFHGRTPKINENFYWGQRVMSKCSGYHETYVNTYLVKIGKKVLKYLKNREKRKLNILICILSEDLKSNKHIHELGQFAKVLGIAWEGRTKQDLCADIIVRLGLFGQYSIPEVT
jgi:ankyrin repeat protein